MRRQRRRHVGEAPEAPAHHRHVVCLAAGSDNVVELYIGYLRRKIDDGRIKLIHTRRGAGYVVRQPSS